MNTDGSRDELRNELKSIFDAEIERVKSTKENGDALSLDEINIITWDSLFTYLTNHAAPKASPEAQAAI
jgi:hypothetical protein